MIERAVAWAWTAWRPREGWLAVGLLLCVVGVVTTAVLDVGWVREDNLLVSTMLLGLGMGSVLAKRPLSAWQAWGLLLPYGVMVTLVWLGNLLPPLSSWFSIERLYAYWRGRGALLADRIWGWGTAVFSGGRSEETIIFAMLLGLIGWFLAAYLGWAAFRAQKPLPALTLLGLALGVNGYFGAGDGVWLAAFVALTAGITAVFHYATLEREWQTHTTDYSPEIKLELTIFAIGIATVIVALAIVLPAIRLQPIVDAFTRLTVVSAAENSAERAFAGVRQPLNEEGNGAGAGEAGSGISVLPRAYLLGNAPELSETVVMTATVLDENENPIRMRGLHWRGASYDVYTGRGWQRSEERVAELRTNEPIEQPAVQQTIMVRQQVVWQFDNRAVRYSLGLPTAIDQPAVGAWRGQTDFVRLVGEGNAYALESRISVAMVAELQTAVLADVPPALLTRYTALSDEIPQRVLDLAQEIGGDLPTPYDQARAIEQFLRQYPYSLDVPLPPGDADPVDYFLFDLQMGYCDYYATSMVVLARAMGLPARMGTGFLAQPADERGVQTLRQINAHSWAEIYFAGYGWVEFEPTAAFATRNAEPTAETGEAVLEPAYPDRETVPPPIPVVEERPFPFWLLAAGLGALFVLVIGVLLWRRPARQMGVRAEFGWLQQHASRLGLPQTATQTPDEFATALLNELAARQPRFLPKQWAGLASRLQPLVLRLTSHFVAVQYGGEVDKAKATGVGREIRPLWWRLRMLTRLPQAKGVPDADSN